MIFLYFFCNHFVNTTYFINYAVDVVYMNVFCLFELKEKLILILFPTGLLKIGIVSAV